MFDLPEPLGPTTTVMPLGNSNLVRSAKLLKPLSSSALSMVELQESRRVGARLGGAEKMVADHTKLVASPGEQSGTKIAEK
jgi:hypothetical protein